MDNLANTAKTVEVMTLSIAAVALLWHGIIRHLLGMRRSKQQAKIGN